MLEVFNHGRFRDGQLVARVRNHGGDFGGKADDVFANGIKERAFSGAITSQQNPLPVRIPNGNRKNPLETFDKTLAQFQIKFRDNRDISLLFDTPPAIGQPGSQFAMVIDFAIANSNKTGGGVDDGLLARSEAANGQASRAERSRVADGEARIIGARGARARASSPRRDRWHPRESLRVSTE